MHSLQSWLDTAHKAAGAQPSRQFGMSQHFTEHTEGKDEVVQAHDRELQKKAEALENRLQVKVGMRMILAAAENLAAMERNA